MLVWQNACKSTWFRVNSNKLKKRIWQSDEKLSQVKYHLPIWTKRPDSSPALCQRHFLHLTHFTIFVNTKFVDRFRAIIYCHLFHRCYITGWAEQDEIFLPKLWNSIGGHTLDNKMYNIINSIVKRGKSISWYHIMASSMKHHFSTFIFWLKYGHFSNSISTKSDRPYTPLQHSMPIDWIQNKQ